MFTNPSSSEACRLYGMISRVNPSLVLFHQLLAFRETGSLGSTSWGAAYYRYNEDIFSYSLAPTTRRYGDVRADPEYYDDSSGTASGLVSRLADGKTKTLLVHFRQASSGLYDIRDPHPFIKTDFRGVQWAFAHNGTISTAIIQYIINNSIIPFDPSYLSSPETGIGQWDFDESEDGSHLESYWNESEGCVNCIDTELFFILVLVKLEENHGCMEKAIWQTIRTLESATAKVKGSVGSLNFLLTDGKTLYALRYSSDTSGYADLYYQDFAPEYRAISSSKSDYLGYGPVDEDEWTLQANKTLLTLRPCVYTTITDMAADTGREPLCISSIPLRLPLKLPTVGQVATKLAGMCRDIYPY
jgi:predicted glutamine amidotransferase